MLLMEAYANERAMGRHENKISLMRKSLNQLSPQEMSDYFDISEQDCISVLNCIREHPDWDDGQIAEEIYWEDD